MFFVASDGVADIQTGASRPQWIVCFVNEVNVRHPHPVHDGDFLVVHPYCFRCRLAKDKAGATCLRLIPNGIEQQ